MAFKVIVGGGIYTGAVSPGPSPADLSGCLLWLRADAGVTLGTGANVASWRDQRGHRLFTAATSITDLPTYNATAGANNTPAIILPYDYNGGSPHYGYFETALSMNYLLQGLENFSIYIVMSRTRVAGDQTDGHALFAEVASTSAGLTPSNLLAEYRDSTYLQTETARGLANDRISTPASDMTTAWGIKRFLFSGSDASNFRRNRWSLTGQASSSSPIAALELDPGLTHTSLKIGQDESSLGALACTIAEIQVWDRVLAAPDSTTLRDYFDDRYGLAV